MNYSKFLELKRQLGTKDGFKPIWMPEFLFDFQSHATSWAIEKGKSAIFADCGLGKTPMQLVWAENVVRQTNKPVLIMTPLAVSAQTVREAKKFGIDCVRSPDGKINGKKIYVTNYERLHYFNKNDFGGVVCDESSILKNFEGATKIAITEFMRMQKYRLLCTATAAPNDYIELGTSSEALGELGYMDMLGMFFKNDQNSLNPSMRGRHNSAWYGVKWRFKHHAETDFWRWVCSWSRSFRKPSDLGFKDGKFLLPKLIVNQTVIKNETIPSGVFFRLPAIGLKEQRRERRDTIQQRCEKVAEIVGSKRTSVVWCHLNPEGDLCEKLIGDCLQVSGRDSDDEKEEKFEAFSKGQCRVLIIKPKIGAFGLNWQHCNHMTFFPSHSWEQYYQGVRRCWRFGQKNPVTVDLVTTEGESNVLNNLKRKSESADSMFSKIVMHMQEVLAIHKNETFQDKANFPAWMNGAKR